MVDFHSFIQIINFWMVCTIPPPPPNETVGQLPPRPPGLPTPLQLLISGAMYMHSAVDINEGMMLFVNTGYDINCSEMKYRK